LGRCDVVVEESADEGADGSCGRISWGWKIEKPSFLPSNQFKNNPCLPRPYYSAAANFHKLSGGTRLAVHSSTIPGKLRAYRNSELSITGTGEKKKRIANVFFGNALIASATTGGANILCCSFGYSEFRGFDNLLLCLLPTDFFY